MPVRKKTLLFATTTATMVMAVTAAVGPFTLFWTDNTRTQRNVSNGKSIVFATCKACSWMPRLGSAATH
jgi:hypothetical protein